MPQSNFTLTDLTRQETLTIWLRRAGLTPQKIAEQTGVRPGAVYGSLEKATIQPYRHDQLVKLGIPANLLPKPVYKAGGNTYPPAGEASGQTD